MVLSPANEHFWEKGNMIRLRIDLPFDAFEAVCQDRGCVKNVIDSALSRHGYRRTDNQPVRYGFGVISRLVGKNGLRRIERIYLGSGDPAIAERLGAGGRRTIVIAGIEAHVCVLQTALDLRAKGLTVAVAADATASRKRESRARALDRLARADVAIVDVEMCLFEWLGTARHKAFKTVSALIR